MKEKMIKRVTIGNEVFYKIEDSDSMRPFFMSIVSASNHWMFISSNGGLTAGRKNSEFSIFPYYTDDKITESSELTGSKTIFQVSVNGETKIWEPFVKETHNPYKVSRNLYKNEYGSKLMFEEINHDLQLTFSYQWNSSNKYGIIRTSALKNNGDTSQKVVVLDGIQNLVPYGVNADLQNRASNLVDAYKRSELDPSSGLGIYALSAIIVDKAEPSEALKANVAWSVGLENPTYLLSSLQLANFKSGHVVQQETDIKAEKGAYFISSEITVEANTEKGWLIAADVNKNHANVIDIIQEVKTNSNLYHDVLEDIEDGVKELVQLTASSDGLQRTADYLKDARHFSNVLFNIMRGGIFDDNYQIEKWDFEKYLKKANHAVYKANQSKLASLPELFTLPELKSVIQSSEDASLVRLATEYLPLKFSRRHGDPSRPWNIFSINTKDETDGSKILDYQGNWRDIYQNWEALACSFPAFIEGMIFKFLNTSTFDGYNPYRVTKDGFDWEIIEPDDPWSYIGYWGDHQIIYLLKFLEFYEKYQPGKLAAFMQQNAFVYAAVPYRIKGYEDILKNPKDTIEFDHDWDTKIRDKKEEMGADGALLQTKEGAVYHVNFMEKILATVLAKVSNFIPEAGIWMNTQRPEWNDANNALVGNGVSMVTLYYLRRFLKFFDTVFAGSASIDVSKELADCYHAIKNALTEVESQLSGSFSDQARKALMDKLGKAASDYRIQIYDHGFSGEKSTINSDDIQAFFTSCNRFMEHAIEANERTDKLYHAYNIIGINGDGVSVSYLSEMLEGQVAALSSGYLNGTQALALLDQLRKSALYRADQNSYLLYPNKNLLGFLQKNTIPQASVQQSALLIKLAQDGNLQIIDKDSLGAYHFNGTLKNAFDLDAALGTLDQEKYGGLIAQDRELVLNVYEEVFNHKEFTGRSGTFYGFEGLGSIYWHMVSKLLLAVQETCLQAIEAEESPEIVKQLTEHFYEIYEGLGVHKSPQLYGAYTIDPYSHTPAGKGAQQPGMTGQVKEDILSRFGELGVFMGNGQLTFDPCLLNKEKEFLTESAEFNYYDVNHHAQSITLEKDSLAFTYCQVPVVYQLSNSSRMEVTLNDGSSEKIDSTTLSREHSKAVSERTGNIKMISVFIPNS